MQPGEPFTKVEEFLRAESTLVLSVSDSSGAVHSAPLFYWPGEQLRLYWISEEKSRHSQAILANPQVSVAVFHSTFDWRAIAGVQMQGTAAVVEDGQRNTVLAGYKARFHLKHVFAAILAASTLYCFRPAWVRYTDNQSLFSRKFELTLHS